jgi:NAD(P)-dependent dehydrogenase (short-subunit alcohol dehydrogenase family)
MSKGKPMNAFLGTPFDLTGRSALVTGGGRGLGKEMARLLASAGAEVAICSRTESEITAAAREIAAEAGVRVEALVADIGRRPEAELLAREASERLGRVDILICNAGTNTPQPVDGIRDEDWDALLELNLTSSMVLTRALAPGMMQRGWGRIIYISSILGLGSAADRVAYSATKSGLHGMMRANALRLGPHGITVNCLAPGPFATELTATRLTAAQRDAFAARTAVGRWGEPAELAPTALLLASPAGGYITGSVLVVDGGVTARMW